MKKIGLTIAAALMVISAAAQNQKLNFEAPLFGVSQKNAKPAWSIVALSGLEIGASYALGVPDAMTPLGYSAEATLLELQARPWRNGDMFSLGVTLSTDRHYLKQDLFAFGDDGSLVSLPPMANCLSMSIERAVSLQLGYIHEFGDWKVGLFLLPGIGLTTERNSYSTVISPNSDALRFRNPYHRAPYFQDNASGNLGFRLGIKAGVWYRNVGLTVGYYPARLGPTSFAKRYDMVKVGLSVRY